MHLRLPASAVLAALFSGCALVIPPYVLPAGAPSATLTNGIDPVLDRNDSIEIRMLARHDDLAGASTLFSITKSRASSPPSAIRIAANAPLILAYREDLSGGRSCDIKVRARLQEGKSYTLRGGSKFDKGLIPILPVRKCQFAVVDDATGAVVSSAVP